MNLQHNFNTLYLLLGLIIFVASCKLKSDSTATHEKYSKKELTKPYAHFNDTFKIFMKAIVIFSPDSMQLKKIKAATKPEIFDGQMHEYEYQLKYSKKILQNEWSQITVFEPNNIRFLLFKTNAADSYIIDLNDYNDPYGVFLFNSIDRPVLADMTNFEQALYQHFKN